MKEQILLKIPTAAACLSSHHETKICIFDPPTEIGLPCQIVEEDAQHDFQVLNPDKKEIHFLAIDKCAIPEEKGVRKCDFVVFDEKEFCFCEVKTFDKNKKRSQRKKDARRQFLSTIEKLEQLDFQRMKVEAIIVLNRTGEKFQPKVPAISMSDSNFRIKALNILKTKVELIESNTKTFL